MVGPCQREATGQPPVPTVCRQSWKTTAAATRINRDVRTAARIHPARSPRCPFRWSGALPAIGLHRLDVSVSPIDRAADIEIERPTVVAALGCGRSTDPVSPPIIDLQ